MARLLPFHLNTHEKKQKRRTHTVLSVIGVAVATWLLAVYIVVRWSGAWLIQNDNFEHIPWVVVLDGQTADLERTDYAAGLLADGKADSVMVLGRRVYRNKNNADFYIEEMLKQGRVDSRRIFPIYHDDPSTLEEARTVIPILKERGIDSVLLITRGPATKRAKQIFTKLSGPGITYLTKDSPDPVFNERTWVHTREGRKVWLKEWTSFLLSKWELLGAAIVEFLPEKNYPLGDGAATPSTPVAPATLPTLAEFSEEADESILLDSTAHDADSSATAATSSADSLPKVAPDIF